METMLGDLKIQAIQQNRNMMKLMRTQSQIMTSLYLIADRMMTLSGKQDLQQQSG